LEAFVYCWTDHLTNMLYVGSHKGSTDDGYVCSSKLMKEQYEIRPQDFTRQIIAQGKTEDVRSLECKILTAINARIDEQFYNQTNGNGERHLKTHTISARQKIGNIHRGKTLSDNHKHIMSETHKGKSKSEEQKKKMSESAKILWKTRKENNYVVKKGKIHSEETKKKLSDATKKRFMNPEERLKSSIAAKKRRKNVK